MAPTWVNQFLIKVKIEWSTEKKMFVVKKCFQAVAYLHQMQPAIIHGDIKPANVLITYDSFLTKLCDLGISRVKGVTTITSTINDGCPSDTPAYIAPESLIEHKEATPESDLWSVGVTVLEFLTESGAWEKEESECEDFMEKVMGFLKRKQLPPGFEKAKGQIWNIMGKCLSFRSSDRPTAKQTI